MRESEKFNPSGLFITLLTALILTVGCSGSSSPVQLSVSQVQVKDITGTSENRYLWGLWEISVSDDHLTADAVPVRTGMMHLNAVGFLEKFPCTTCLNIGNLAAYPDNRLSADLKLTHPFPGNNKLTGFDVRAIFISEGSYEFPDSGRTIPWNEDVPRLLLPNGYTSLFNMAEYDPSLPGADIFKYIEGKYANGEDLKSTLNGYVSFRREAPRNMFESGGSETRTVWIQVPDGPFKFGYAIDCCWKKVDGQVLDPLTDFPPDANCLEAYRVDVQLGSNLQPFAGSTQPIEVRVFDHQGLGTVSQVTVEAPELFSGMINLEYDEDVGIDTHLYTVNVTNETGVGTGSYPMLVRVVDTQEDPNLGSIEAYFLYTVEIGSRKGWVHTWGGDYSDGGAPDYAVSSDSDSDGNVYVTGQFWYTVDLDPTDGIEEHTATIAAVFLTKFDTNGNFIWTRVLDGMGWDAGERVKITHGGQILLLGYMDDLMDLDPGVNTDAHEGHLFLCCLDLDGNYIYGLSWDIGSYGLLAVDGFDNILIAGEYYQEEDFDPTDGEDIRTPLGERDIFLIKLYPDGTYYWTRTWGSLDVGFGHDAANSLAADSMGNIYVSGRVDKEADFDTGSGTMLLGPGRFITRYYPTGQFFGANIWKAYVASITVDASDNFYVLGSIEKNYTIDLDLGPDVDELTGPCTFLASYEPDTDYRWGKSWGMSLVNPIDVCASGTNEIYLTGYFEWNLVDFDPSGNTDYHASAGNYDIFLTKYLTDGEYQWTRTFGGDYSEQSRSVSSDDAGNAFVAGDFLMQIDFDPGPGVEYREGLGNGDCYLIKIPPDGNW